MPTATLKSALTAAMTSVLVLVVTVSSPVIAQKSKGDAAAESATETARKIREATGVAAPAAKQIPPGDPCTVLSISDVQRAFPGAKAGERSRRLEQYGITECSWKLPDGRIVMSVQESFSKGTAKEDVQGMASGFTDPLKPQSRNNVRYEPMASIGSQAMAMVEQQDAKRGILSDAAMLSLHQGDHRVWLMSGELPQRDRAAALKVLEDLGKVAAKRLQ
jgi:hypothetical protein